MSISAENDSQGEYHSMHGPLVVDIDSLIPGRDVCSDLSTIDDEISPPSQLIFDPIHMQDQITEKSSDDSLIHRVPVEILSLMFILVKEAYDDEYLKPTFMQPRTSVPLLIGAICKEWREITLQTPHLWTYITVDLGKPTKGQVCMIKEWAFRAGALPIDLEVLMPSGEEWYEDDIPEGASKAIARVLRPFALRWNDVTLCTPWYFCGDLFEDLEESPSLGSLHFSVLGDPDARLRPIKLRHPFRVKRFCSWNVSGRELPLEWENLVHLEVCEIDDVQILHIIRHAQRLRYCSIETKYIFAYGHGSLLTPTATTHIIHHSLVYLKTTIDIFGHLTLPSLQHLDYCRLCYGPDYYPNSLVDFINRSSPPLETFSLKCELRKEEPDEPSLEKFPGITSLSIKVYFRTICIDPVLHLLTKPSAESTFPRLGKISLEPPSMSPSSWTLASRLFKKDIKQDNPDLNDHDESDPVVFASLPLSNVQIHVSRDSELMDKDTFLHFLAVKKSGFNLDLMDDDGDLFHKMAKLYDSGGPTMIQRSAFRWMD